MARLRYNGLRTTLGASLTNSATSVTFGAALTHSNGTNVPTITGSDYIPLAILDSSGHLSEIVWLTAYTAAATTGTITRGQEGTSGVTHSSGDAVVGTPLVSDINSYALDPVTLHATYGDHFTGSSLDAKWTRAGSYVSGDETYRQGGGTWMTTSFRTPGSYYYQAAPASDFSVVMRATVADIQGSTMFGLLILDNSSNGVGGGWYNGNPDAAGIFSVGAGAYNSSAAANPTGSSPRGSFINNGVATWYKVTKSGTTYTLGVSVNGNVWTPPCSITSSITPTRIGFGTFFGGATHAGVVGIDFFDVQ